MVPYAIERETLGHFQYIAKAPIFGYIGGVLYRYTIAFTHSTVGTLFEI